MEGVAAFFAAHGILFWLSGFIVVVGVLEMVVPKLCKIRNDWTFYYDNREIFDRQYEMEKWLKDKFEELGIKVKFQFSRHAFSDTYEDRLTILQEENLFFRAEDFDYEKIKGYKRIMGVLMNRFPWIKVGDEGNFSPARFLDREWAVEYAVEKYAHKVYGTPCKCGCNQAWLLDYEWRSLKETLEDEVILDPRFDPERNRKELDCKKFGPGEGIRKFRGLENLYAREQIATLTPQQVAKLNVEIKLREDKAAEDRRVAEEQRLEREAQYEKEGNGRRRR